MAYTQLLEQDLLDEARAIDARYHAAKLVAAAFVEPERIWTEHEAMRAALLAPRDAEPTALSTEDHLALAARIHERLIAAGVLSPTGGVH